MKEYQPLPEEWEEQYDPGSGRHFFWNRRTDRVSWFPPGHPKARIMEAASQVRQLLQSQLSNMDEDDDEDEEEDQAMDLDSDMVRTKARTLLFILGARKEKKNFAKVNDFKPYFLLSCPF